MTMLSEGYLPVVWKNEQVEKALSYGNRSWKHPSSPFEEENQKNEISARLLIFEKGKKKKMKQLVTKSSRFPMTRIISPDDSWEEDDDSFLLQHRKRCDPATSLPHVR